MSEEVKLTKVWDVRSKTPFFDIRANGVQITINLEQFKSLYGQMMGENHGIFLSQPMIGDDAYFRKVDEAFIAEWGEKAK